MRASRALAAMIVAGLLAAACTSGPTPPTAPPGGTGSSGAPSTATGGASPAPSLPSQTDTAWGRIWDALPPSFPMPLGGQPATDTGEGASSGQLLVPAARDAVVGFYRDAFRDAQFTVGTDGPLEDGSVILTAENGYQCRIQLSVRASGTQSMATVLYGAGCPFA